MPLTAASFDNPAVEAATGFHPDYGYFHGPIPNSNDGWVPAVRQANPKATVTPTDNINPGVPGVKLSTINGLVCDVVFNEGMMCGITCGDQPALRRHMRDKHPGAIINPPRTNTKPAEIAAGKTSLKKWVLSGGWRDAEYIQEPYLGPENSLLREYADACEAIAADDSTFANKFGTKFNREPKVKKTTKRKRDVSPPVEEAPRPRPVKKARSTANKKTKASSASSSRRQASRKSGEPTSGTRKSTRGNNQPAQNIDENLGII